MGGAVQSRFYDFNFSTKSARTAARRLPPRALLWPRWQIVAAAHVCRAFRCRHMAPASSQRRCPHGE